jgi:PAS domain S-box-containing protein
MHGVGSRSASRGWAAFELLLLLLAPPSAAQPPGPLALEPVLKAVIPSDAPPTYYRDKQTGAASGFAVDVMNLIARREGVRVEYQFEDGWDDIIRRVTSGRADLAPNLSVSDARRELLAFTDPVEVFKISLFVRAEDTGVNRPPGARRVGVIQGSLAADMLKSRPGLEIQSFRTFSEGLFSLLGGRLDGFAGPEPTLWQVAREVRLEDRVRVDQEIGEVRQAIAVRRDDTALLHRLNAALAGLPASPDYQAIYARWYGRPTPFWTTTRIGWAAGLSILAVAAIMAGWRHRSVVGLNRRLASTVADLDRASTALRDSEARFRSVFERSVDAIGVSKAGVHTFVNPAYARLFGYRSADELNGVPVLDLIAPPERGRIMDFVRLRERGDGRPAAYETAGLRKDGTEFVLDVHASDYELFGERYTLVLLRDVTEPRAAGRAVRESEERLRAFLNAITESAFLIDPDGVVLVANRTVAERFGLDQADVIGRCMYDLLPEDVAAGRRLFVADVLRTGEPVRFEDERAGRTIDNSIFPVRNAEGEVVSLAIVGSDISARKRAEDRIRRSERRIREITASLGEGLFVLDRAGALSFMNPEAERLLGWTESEVLGKRLHDVIHNRKADLGALSFEECVITRAAATGSRLSSSEEVFVARDGTVLPVAVIASPITEGGAVVGSVTAFRDIREVKRTEAERESLIAKLQDALAAIRTLQGTLPICSNCKRIRNDLGAWQQLESYISEHSDAMFSHGLCAECLRKMYPEFAEEAGQTGST